MFDKLLLGEHAEVAECQEASTIASMMISRGAYDAESGFQPPAETGFFPASREAELALEDMQAASLVYSKGAGERTSCFLNQRGITSLRACTLATQIRHVFVVPATLAIKDATPFQLAKRLQLDGWEWREWLPKSRQPKRLALEQPALYLCDGPKVWYTSALTVSPLYLYCLANATELFAAGVEGIPHRTGEKQHRALIKGKVLPPLAVADIGDESDVSDERLALMDVDAEASGEYEGGTDIEDKGPLWGARSIRAVLERGVGGVCVSSAIETVAGKWPGCWQQ